MNTDNLNKENALALNSANSIFDSIEKDILEFAQGPTDFQIEVFIANGEGPVHQFPAHAYRHLLAQVRPLISEIRRVALDKERTQRKIERLSLNKPEDWDLDLMDLEFRLKDLDIELKGKWDMYQTYDRLLATIKEKYGPFTNQQLQEKESEYWSYRLSKQMLDSRNGAMTGYGPGNLNSLRMALEGSLIEGSPNRIKPFELNDQNLSNNLETITKRLES